MSHHLDTPLAAQTGQLYIDDLYVFPGQNSTVLVMDVNSNVNGLHSEPGFHPEARYEFKAHFDGADFETLTYRVSFSGKAVAADLFPDVLPYVIGTPAVYGFAARNGRTLADNAPEAMLSLVTGTAVLSGLKPSGAKDQRATPSPTSSQPDPSASEMRAAFKTLR